MSPSDTQQAVRVAILTLSDKAARGEREDTAGPAARDLLAATSGHDVVYRVIAYEVVADDEASIVRELRSLCGRQDVDVVLTTGGTGLAPRDVTPQATRAVMDYEVPGIAEAMRAESTRITPAGMLSRGLAAVSGRTLIVNMPGNPKAVRETLPILLSVLPHAVSSLRGQVGEHSRPGHGGL